MKITIYTTSSCGLCSQLKKFLDYKKLNYETVNLDEQPEKRSSLIELSGYSIVPQTLVEKDGQPKVIIGYNIKELSNALSPA